ncbi:MAG: biopolymer transporter ExbD [Salinisphaeraceae bacterium]|jgi:biopolymer transport protein ExbD|nr:biopolymer transporter ExbD [Salinisphaeraceae bacterium]
MRARYSQQSAEESEDINMTPMLDVVFILLIFFIVTTSFVKETGIDVVRPTAQTAQQKNASNILIGIRDNGEIWIDKRRVQLDAVRANVERMLAEAPEASVIVIADHKAETGVLVDTMDQARLAGAENVSIAAERN